MMNTRVRSLRSPGFTLIELLVVVAIIALLIAILLPSLARAREQTYQVKCAAHLGGIFKGMFYYAEDKDNGGGWLPQLSFYVAEQWAAGGVLRHPHLSWHGAIWTFQILPYVDVRRSKAGTRAGFFRCPAEKDPAYRYITNELRRESIGFEVVNDPIGLKSQYDSGSGTNKGVLGGASKTALGPWIEPVSFSGSDDSNLKGSWYVVGATGVAEETTRKLDGFDKPHCYPLLTDMAREFRGGRGFRYVHLRDSFANPAYPGFRRHYGGENPFNNGGNWMFADGHVAWNSVQFSSTSLVCCIELGKRGATTQRENEWDSIRATCAARGQ